MRLCQGAPSSLESFGVDLVLGKIIEDATRHANSPHAGVWIFAINQAHGESLNLRGDTIGHARCSIHDPLEPNIEFWTRRRANQNIKGHAELGLSCGTPRRIYRKIGDLLADKINKRFYFGG